MLDSPPDARFPTGLCYASGDIREAIAFTFFEVTTVSFRTYFTPSTTPLTAVLIDEAERFAEGGKMYPSYSSSGYEM
jgi:hypothetical protein